LTGEFDGSLHDQVMTDMCSHLLYLLLGPFRAALVALKAVEADAIVDTVRPMQADLTAVDDWHMSKRLYACLCRHVGETQTILRTATISTAATSDMH
jgi:hypothetical protein